MIKPDARIIPSEDEFESWTLHPVTQFVAAAYAAKAQECRDRWTRLFHSNIVPADLDTQRRLLSSQEECFRAFFESYYPDFLRAADPKAFEELMERRSEERRRERYKEMKPS